MAFCHGCSCFNSHSPILGFTTFLLIMILTLLYQVSEGRIINDASLRFDEPYHRCNLFQGNWVFDQTYKSFYNHNRCPFIEKGLDCLKNGRPDHLYLKYRWKPSRCNLSRFNGQTFLEKYKGKQIMFVGDSSILNQWQSLACMLHATVQRSNYTLVREKLDSNLTFSEYKISIIYKWKPFLVDLVNEQKGKVLKLDTINGGNSWKKADMLIFNTWKSWLNQEWDYIQVGNTTYTNMNHTEAFKIALSTWGRWVDSNVVSWKTKVVFRGISLDHHSIGDEKTGQKPYNCRGHTKPTEGSPINLYDQGYPNLAAVYAMKEVLRGMSTPIYLLDITELSQLRIDAHPGYYVSDNDDFYEIDCSNWCLPGLPDTWNQLLYSTLKLA